MTNRTYRPWSHVEDAIIHAHLTDGRGAIQRELRLAGYDRSLDQIKGRLRRLRSATTEQLKPCPFCGSKAAIHTQRSESLWSHDIVTWTRVECSNEDCAITTESRCEGWEPTPIESWNRRAPTGATHE